MVVLLVGLLATASGLVVLRPTLMQVPQRSGSYASAAGGGAVAIRSPRPVLCLPEEDLAIELSQPTQVLVTMSASVLIDVGCRIKVTVRGGDCSRGDQQQQ